MTMEETIAEMNEAAIAAGLDLRDRMDTEHFDEGTLHIIAQWIRDHYRTAGYKRLAKQLAQFKG